ncbi:glycosyltransferase family 4 protein [Microvirga sp. ACRRW]|uniref:glycosyltransferase family 4 protein n=1 Tax=Microvirga sp. ACRRW TaxID=2918205 RepID=UPI001EF738F3|nr:glycosyltransferase family 4 protein [Microvirga sp. ACRRW]MCG7391573.1 glycosyltransferase family 4 protein [Microvirga sp. ACRRW]
MKVLIVETDDCGGLLHFSFQLASSLQMAGVNVTVLANHNNELSDIAHPFKIDPSLRFWSRVASPNQRSKRRFLRKFVRAGITMREWIRIIRIVRREKPDYTIFSLLRNPIEVAAVSYLHWRGHRLIDICHEFLLRERHGHLSQLVNANLMKFLYTRFACVIFISEKTMLEFKESVSSSLPTYAISHGPEAIFPDNERERKNLRQRYGLREDEPVILFFGGLRPSKGLDVLVEAFSLVPSGTARLLIVGYPSQEFKLDELREQIEHLGIQQETNLDPRYVPMSEVGSLVSLASILVFPYKTATASAALSLAQTHGRAAIASDVGGLAEVIQHGVDGWLVPPGDAEALKDAMLHLLKNSGERRAIGDAAKERIESERSWDAMADRVVHILENNAVA